MHWYNLDPRRLRKTTGLAIDTGRLVRPVITPDSPDDVVAALVGHGVAPTF